MTEVIFVSTKRNSSIGYLQQGTSVPYEKPYFNALVEKVLGKKSSEYISREIESYSNKKRFVIVLNTVHISIIMNVQGQVF